MMLNRMLEVGNAAFGGYATLRYMRRAGRMPAGEGSHGMTIIIHGGPDYRRPQLRGSSITYTSTLHRESLRVKVERQLAGGSVNPSHVLESKQGPRWAAGMARHIAPRSPRSSTAARLPATLVRSRCCQAGDQASLQALLTSS
jgi:hypothetical protein